MLLWVACLLGVPKLSPVRTAEARIVRVYFIPHLDKDGSGWRQYAVLFRPSDRAWPGPFTGIPQQAGGWSETVEMAYRYRVWDRALLSVRAADGTVDWHGLGDHHRDGYQDFVWRIVGAVLILQVIRLIWNRRHAAAANAGDMGRFS
jgi:hypothetical protein